MGAINEFIQRQGTTGTIAFQGKAAILYQNGVKIASSTTENGSFTGVAQGSGYIMKVAHDDGTVGRYKIAIGAIVDAIGASNMGHWFSSASSTVSPPDTYMLKGNGTWSNVRGGPAEEFAAKLQADLGCPVGIIDGVSSGSALLPQDTYDDHTYWLNGPAYQNFLDTIQSIGGRVEDVMWAGGEPDGLNRVSEAAFEAGFAQLCANIHTDTGAQIFVQQIGLCNNPRVNPYFQGIWQAEQNVAGQYTYVDIGANGMDAVLNDAHHYTTASYMDLADSMAASIFAFDSAPPPAPPVIAIRENMTSTLLIANNTQVVVQPGVSIIDASVDGTTRTDNMAGAGNAKGGGDKFTVWGDVEGFVGAYFGQGSDLVVVQNGGRIYGFNAGVEFHDGGGSVLTVNAGGYAGSDFYGVWGGDTPHVDYHLLPNSGDDTIRNFGEIEGIRREAIRLVEGGNHINNAGLIKADFEQAIEIDSDATFGRNFIANSGQIIAGPRGPAIISGDAAMTIANTGTITGDINLGAGKNVYTGNGTVNGSIHSGDGGSSVTNDGTITGDVVFGAGKDTYGGAGSVHGTVSGGGGNDVLTGGTADIAFNGGAGADLMTAGTGTNTFVYAGAGDSSTGIGVDVIDGFDFSRDHIVVAGHTITSFDQIHALGSLQAGHAAIAQNANGVFLVIDENGQAGYQAGADIEIKLVDAHHIPVPATT
ncbi:MAG TPA: sialate O-acetylesterase [Rhizomicrobium sp.]|jgi:hypothetical protein